MSEHEQREVGSIRLPILEVDNGRAKAICIGAPEIKINESLSIDSEGLRTYYATGAMVLLTCAKHPDKLVYKYTEHTIPL